MSANKEDSLKTGSSQAEQPCSYRTAYTKLSIHYFFYFSVLGALLPYLGLYFQSLSFSPVEIGQLLGVLMATKVIAPNVWGWLSDRSGLPIKWVRLATGLTVVSGIGLVSFASYWPLLLTVLFFSFFWHASLPQFESYTFGCLGDEKHRYGEIRLWGSVGFIAAVVLIGWQIEQVGVGVLPWDLFALLTLVWLTTFLVRDRGRRIVHEDDSGFMQIVRQPAVWHLLLVSFLVQLSHGTYYAFFTIHLSELGYDKTSIAWLWALGVIAEIGVFLYMSRLFQAYSVRFLILLSIVLTLIRWLMNAYLADHLGWMLVAQTLHAASFGLFHAAAIHLIDHFFRGRHHGKGQAIFAASSHGLGGAVGMLSAGYAWSWGHAELAYGLSALAVLVAWWFAWRGVRV
ncbi:MFS transporter [Thiomicrorhabdus sp. zzn3]|uniref:MFS transporter n=1 Tax=Thiomicrorhabdus sp. zzn3 TaxID=3039775 RepID=UPI002436AB84|nr:MFS transporter [Thiomicrorhabdus sp. zzn3]MDG6778383.1 MFS transporter [Thiomicrorhabdus sp. zzn3]